MSSPLSSLKKNQKTPLFPGSSNRSSVPFRSPAYTEDESKLLDEITGHMSSQRLKVRDPFARGLPKLDTSRSSHAGGATHRSGVGSSNAPNDHELMSIMMTRITQLEAKLAFQNKELADKDIKIKVLEDKVRLLSLQKSQDNSKDSAHRELETKYLLLQQQVHEMETFLADYGMVWVGEKSKFNSSVYNEDTVSDSGEEEGEEEEVWHPESSMSKSPPFKVDYNLLIENIQELNILAGEGVSKIQHTIDGARLKMPDPVNLTLFANGIMLYSGPFRPFSDPLTQQCIQDLTDGYFPSELQNRYPDGIPFNVIDKRNVHFKANRPTIFTGAGQVLGGETKPSRLVPTNLDKDSQVQEQELDLNLEITSELPGPQLTVEQFLNKLPRSVIKEGKIIDIRESIGETLKGPKESPTNVTLIETSVLQEMKKRLETTEKRPYTPRDITTLRIKSETGNHTYIVKMRFHETIGDLRKYLDQQRGPGSGAYQIMSAYPNRIHDENAKTLEASGLTPNAVLILRSPKTS
ncbi:hypothetical protein CHS0354_006725 [Potamilus streckersoni]|uniref:UBX domain-containing protein 11 n=1 Tax=Potamilus streckersoni TaxID=2493646 RepID=A0AAE0RR85_9BIVA|nr:hypothetical protein CHS0354_006725 [Potamilus streckersoni]